MTWRNPFTYFLCGIAILIAGLAYGALMVGVPTQDPTPAIATAENRDTDISDWVMLIGLGVTVISLLWIAALGIARLARRN